MDVNEDGRISAAEAAARLGVKVDTIYAYVSRGYLRSIRRPGGRSTFDLHEVETLMTSGTREPLTNSRPFQFHAITTRVTAASEGQLNYRGRDALQLAGSARFEEVAGLLWTGDLIDQPIEAPESVASAVMRMCDALPTADATSRLRLALTVAAAFAETPIDLSQSAVIHSASISLACMLVGAGTRSHDVETAIPTLRPVGSVTERLWRSLAAPEADSRLKPCLEMALILMADHGLAASTVAVRATASARAHLYDVLAAGLACVGGSAHGATNTAAHNLIERVGRRRRGAEEDTDVLDHYRRNGGAIPGLAERSPADPRARVLLDHLDATGAAHATLADVASIVALRGPSHELKPTVELALGALAAAAGMREGATQTITSIAHAVGWTAHALEEYAETPARWRAREMYTGPDIDR